MSKLITISGSPGIGKFDLLEDLSKYFVPIKKQTTRIPLAHETESKYMDFVVEMPRETDIVYSHYNSTYGINLKSIKEQINRGKNCSVFTSNISVIKKLKIEFSKSLVTIWLDSANKDEPINTKAIGEVPEGYINERQYFITNLQDQYKANPRLFDLNIQYSALRESISTKILNFLGSSIILNIEDQEIIREIESDLIITNNKLLEFFSKHPEKLYELSPRNFEILIAELMNKFGYDVTLSPKIKDGGYDVKALKKDGIGEFLYLIECKRYRKDRPVGVELVRQLNTIRQINHANKAGIITTSHFTSGALDLKRQFGFEIELNDFEKLNQWLQTIN